MDMKDAVSQGGPGAFLLFIYIYGSLYYWIPSVGQGARLFSAASVAFVFSILLELSSDYATGFITLPVISRTKQGIDQVAGEGHFYWDHEGKQEQLDKFDEQVFRYTVVIYSGVLICLSLPIQAFAVAGIYGGLIAIGVDIIVFSAFIYLPFKKVRNIIETSVKLYG